MESFAGEQARFRAFGNQLIVAHLELRDLLDGLAAVLETHFIGEEKRLVRVLNALDAPDLEGWDEGS